MTIGLIAIVMFLAGFFTCKIIKGKENEVIDNIKNKDTLEVFRSRTSLNNLILNHKKYPSDLNILFSIFGDHRTPKTTYEFYARLFWGDLANMKTLQYDKTKIDGIINNSKGKNFVIFNPNGSKDMNDINNVDFTNSINYTDTHNPYISCYPVSMFEFIKNNMGTNKLEVTKGYRLVHVDSNNDGRIDYNDDSRECNIVMFHIKMNAQDYYLDIVDDPSISYP